MSKYEIMFIIRPDIAEEERKTVFAQINDAVIKHGGNVEQGAVWAEKKKLFFPIKKHLEGVYYLLTFSAETKSIKELRQIYRLNENILRFMVSVL